MNSTLKELREVTGMNKKQFAEYFKIPYRTYQNWELESVEKRKVPNYLVELMKYKLIHEGLIQEERGNDL